MGFAIALTEERWEQVADLFDRLGSSAMAPGSTS